MIALIIGLVVSLIVIFAGTPVLIRVVEKMHYGQYIRQDGPKSHQVKRGTPTMGGVVIILSAVLGWLAFLPRYTQFFPLSQHRLKQALLHIRVSHSMRI